jgi:hypothetical protein
MTIELLTNIVGWCSVINLALIAISALVLATFRQPIIHIHSRLTGVEEFELPKLYFKYLASYKLLTLIFSVVPYIALRLSM